MSTQKYPYRKKYILKYLFFSFSIVIPINKYSRVFSKMEKESKKKNTCLIILLHLISFQNITLMKQENTHQNHTIIINLQNRSNVSRTAILSTPFPILPWKMQSVYWYGLHLNSNRKNFKYRIQGYCRYVFPFTPVNHLVHFKCMADRSVLMFRISTPRSQIHKLTLEKGRKYNGTNSLCTVFQVSDIHHM